MGGGSVWGRAGGGGGRRWKESKKKRQKKASSCEAEHAEYETTFRLLRHQRLL